MLGCLNWGRSLRVSPVAEGTDATLRSPSVNAPCPHSQVDLTFTAEGTDAHPSSLSLRGLDYGAYYRSNGVSN